MAQVYSASQYHPWLSCCVQPLRLIAAKRDDRLESKTDATAGRQGDRTDDLQAAADKIGGHLFHARLRLVIAVPPEQAPRAREKLRTMAAAFGAFTLSRLALFRMGRIKRGSEPLIPTPSHSFYLSHTELATLFHPPTAHVAAERMARTPFTELAAPVTLASGKESGGVVLGRVQYKADVRTYGMGVDDRRRHLYVVGKTGMGKTTLLKNMIRADIATGHGLAVIDPHGDLADEVIADIPRHRTNDVIVFDPADDEYAIAFNPLARRQGLEDLIASGVVAAVKKLYDSWGPRLEDTLRNAVYLAIENEGTLLSLLGLLTDEAQRLRSLANCSDPLVRSFWSQEFSTWNDRYRTEAVAAILNKIRPFLLNRDVRAVVSQSHKGLDLRQVMDEGKVLLVNLSKGRLGEDNASLLGSLLVTKLQIDAMTRADVAEGDRRDFAVYVDEFQNFTTESFATILSEARKYRLQLVCSHQYLAQLDDGTRESVFGNVGSMISFQLGIEDVDVMARQLSKHEGQVKPEDLANLPKYHAYVRLLQDGMPEQPFSMQTLLPVPTAEDRTATVRRASHNRYATPKRVVLAEIDEAMIGTKPRNNALARENQGSRARMAV